MEADEAAYDCSTTATNGMISKNSISSSSSSSYTSSIVTPTFTAIGFAVAAVVAL